MPVAAIGTVLVLRRPRWLVFPFAAVTAFGVYGHCSRLTERWPAIDWIAAMDVAAIAGLPIGLWLLMIDRRRQSPRTS
jgi:hypothetical protein